MTESTHYDAYPVLCRFPGCGRPAPLATDGIDVSLCLEHERLRFYQPAEFQREWQEGDPERC